MPETKMSVTDQAFLQGILYALASINITAVFDEVVRHCGQGPLVTEARRSGQMRRSGMSEYLRRNKKG